MYLNTKGLVIRVTPYNDTDALLSVLTPEHGRLTVKARGLRRKNSPLIAPCQLLSYAEFTLFEYRNMYTINEAHAIELFSSLRKDLQKLSLGSYFAQAAETLSQEDLPNPELLSLVWNNLISNAVKFTPEGGTIGVALKTDANAVIVSVRDTGCGMTQEVGQHIFEKFYQGDTSHSKEGNGLGLSLAKRVLEISGGTISVRSAPGEGSEFIVRLKRITEPQG